MKTTICAALLAAAMAPGTGSAQSLAGRVNAEQNGVLSLTYPARPGVEICDQGIRMGRHRIMWHSRGWGEAPLNCRTGPVEIELRLRDGEVREIEVIRHPGQRSEGVVGLGSVAPEEAVAFLLETAGAGGRSGRGLEDAVFPAVLADVEEVWRELLGLARDRTLRGGVRTSALFWVGQEAAEAVTVGLTDLALEEEEDQEIRDAAVFALSRRPNDEAVPILMAIARMAPQAETRRSAMFWLAESKDDRVYAFFEEILTRRGGG
jgi:hypothetical protein